MTWLIFVPIWFTDEKVGLTPATWLLFFATACLVLTGLGAIWFANSQLDADRKQRRVENLARVLDEFNGRRMRFFRSRFAEGRMNAGKLIRKDETKFPEYGLDVLDFCEHVAFLTRNDHLDPVQVCNVLGNWIGAYHHDLAAHVERLARLQKTAYEDLLWLVGHLREIDVKRGGLFFTSYGDDDLERLYAYDLKLLDVDQASRD
jgi:hypothetical protein